MTIYQVIDEENRAMFETTDQEQATQEAELLALMYEEHQFSIETTIVNQQS